MKRTMIALFALALAFVFAGSAMAYNAKMATKCAPGTYTEHLLTFPYMPGAVDGWWQVFSVTNKSAAAIKYEDLCMVGVTVGDLVDEDGDPRIFKLDEAVQYAFPETGSIPANGIIADALTPTAPGIYALFGKAGTANANVKGFAMFGNTMAHGYFALNNATTVNGTTVVYPDVQGSSYLEFDYYPNMINPWATGMAVTHNATETVKLTFTFRYASGTEIVATKNLPKESIVMGSMSDLFEEVGTNTRARVQVTHNGTQTDVGLQGFMFFGDGEHGMGYLGNPTEIGNATGFYLLDRSGLSPHTP